MKNKLYITAALISSLFVANNAYSAASAILNDLDNPAVTINSSAVDGAPNELVFNPSTNVLLGGLSDTTSFQVNGYHNQALGKAAGQAYGMAADSNKMFFLSIEDQTADVRVNTGTTSAALGSFTSM